MYKKLATETAMHAFKVLNDCISAIEREVADHAYASELSKFIESLEEIATWFRDECQSNECKATETNEDEPYVFEVRIPKFD